GRRGGARSSVPAASRPLVACQTGRPGLSGLAATFTGAGSSTSLQKCGRKSADFNDTTNKQSWQTKSEASGEKLESQGNFYTNCSTEAREFQERRAGFALGPRDQAFPVLHRTRKTEKDRGRPLSQPGRPR